MQINHLLVFYTGFNGYLNGYYLGINSMRVF